MTAAPVLDRLGDLSTYGRDDSTHGWGESLPPRHEPPRLLVAVDGSAGSQRRLVRALREAVRRDATVLAVAVIEIDAPVDIRIAARTALQAQALTAEIESGVPGRSRTVLVDPIVYEAMTTA